MENQKDKKSFSIKTKITFSIVFFVFVVLSIVFISLFFYFKKIVRDDFRLRLLDMASIASLQIDGDEHSVLKTISDEETIQYKNIVKELKDIQENSSDIYYIYTMRENIKGEVTFIVDPDDSDPSDISHIGDKYEDASQFLKENFSKIDKSIVEKDFYKDQWGMWLSGYAPIYNKEGVRDGVLGIDINSEHIISEERKIEYILLIIYFVFIIFATILGLYISGKLTNSIKSLTSILKDNNDGHDLRSSPIMIDEIEELSGALKSKLNEVNLSQKGLIKELEIKAKTLEKINKLMVGRELEMIRLKKEIIDLKNNKINQ